jgi:hypothetical protein
MRGFGGIDLDMDLQRRRRRLQHHVMVLVREMLFALDIDALSAHRDADGRPVR